MDIYFLVSSIAIGSIWVNVYRHHFSSCGTTKNGVKASHSATVGFPRRCCDVVEVKISAIISYIVVRSVYVIMYYAKHMRRSYY